MKSQPAAGDVETEPVQKLSRRLAGVEGPGAEGCQCGSGGRAGSDEFFDDRRCVTFGSAYALSRREISIVRLTCRGMTRKQIAKELGIAVDSVHKYCDRVHKKVRVKDRVGLILKVIHCTSQSPACHYS